MSQKQKRLDKLDEQITALLYELERSYSFIDAAENMQLLEELSCEQARLLDEDDE